MYRYYFSEENGVLFKSGYEGSLEKLLMCDKEVIEV